MMKRILKYSKRNKEIVVVDGFFQFDRKLSKKSILVYESQFPDFIGTPNTELLKVLVFYNALRKKKFSEKDLTLIYSI